jgi:hypothetical protein
MNDSFSSEAELFEAVDHTEHLRYLHCPTWNVWADSEVDGFFGRPDYLIGYCRIDSLGRRQVRSVAFEFKLSNWNQALTQAFRYTAFVHYAYVLMDDCFVGRALLSLDRFSKANIGLLSFSTSGSLQVHHRPALRSPYAPALREKLYKRVCAELL